MMIYKDRRGGPEKLWLRSVRDYRGIYDGLVLGLPRGGIVVAEEVAQDLKLPLDVVLLRKLPFPDNPEFAVGAIAEDGSIFLNSEFPPSSGQFAGWRLFLDKSDRIPFDALGATF